MHPVEVFEMGKEPKKPGFLQRMGIGGKKPEPRKIGDDLAIYNEVEIELVPVKGAAPGELSPNEDLLAEVWKDIESGKAWTKEPAAKPPEKK